MDEDFDIPVLYNNKEIAFKTKLLKFGYSYRFEVDIYGNPVIFEPDEERNLRAIIAPSKTPEDKFDTLLLQKIATAIESLIKG